MTKPTDATSPHPQPAPPKPASEELDEKDLEHVSGGITFPAGDGGAKDAVIDSIHIKM